MGKIQADAVSLSPAQTPLSQAEQGWARLLQQNLDTLYGSLMLPEKRAAINQDMQRLQYHPGGQVKTQTAGTRNVRHKRPEVRDDSARVCSAADVGAVYADTKRRRISDAQIFYTTTSCSLTRGSAEKYTRCELKEPNSVESTFLSLKPCHNFVPLSNTLLSLRNLLL